MGVKLTLNFDHIIVIDCPFRWKFDGGHIDGPVSPASGLGTL